MQMRFIVLLILILATNGFQSLHAQQRAYTIGNSLTNDMRPQLLDQSQWHIFCSKNLDFIFNNPDGNCVQTSTPWPEAFQDFNFEYVVVQPFDGTTLTQDANIISAWMQLQPEATFVIHSGWTQSSTFPEDYLAGNPDNTMRPSPEYVNDLIAQLKLIFPNRPIVQTHANDLLFSVWLDVQQANAPGIRDVLFRNFGTNHEPIEWPFEIQHAEAEIELPFDEFSDIYRDFIHMDLQTGRYLMHNALRYAVRQPLFPRELFPGNSENEFLYLEDKIRTELVLMGDINRDRLVNLLDIQPFIEVLTDGIYDITADMNADNRADLLDIGPFIDAILNVQ